MLSKPLTQKRKVNKDIVGLVINAASEEVEKVGDSVVTQVAGESASSDQQNPISEAMQQKTEEEETGKQNKINEQKRFLRTREDLDVELRELKKKREEQEKTWSEEAERQFKIIDPGENMVEKPAIPLTSKPKRGQMPGRPGTAKGETGPEVRKSKQ